MTDRRARTKGRRGGMKPFFPLDKGMLSSSAWAALSPYAIKLIVDLGAYYNGNNNGDLCATWKFMKARGWRSPSTLNRAIKEAIAKKFLMLSRQGGLHSASLYALTFFPINSCGGKIELQVTVVAAHTWKQNSAPSPEAYQSSPPAYQSVGNN